MRCLVTGCAGFIGSHLSESLVEAGHQVRGIDSFTDYYPKRVKLLNIAALRKAVGFEFIEADLSSSGLGPVVRGVDAVFHLAGQPGVRASWGKSFSHYVKDNITATQRLLEAVKAAHVKKFVYASSSSVYGDAEGLPTSEQTIPRPISPYGATKLAGEHLCNVYFSNYSLPVVVLRYFTVYGPRQRPDMAFSRFISRISRGGTIEVLGDGQQRRDFTFVKNIVQANVLALDAKPGSTYNVGAGRNFSLAEVISIIEEIIGKEAKVVHRDAALGDVRNTCADIATISRDLGYRPVIGLADGLRLQCEASRRRLED